MLSYLGITWRQDTFAIQRVNQEIRLLTIWSQHSSSAQEKQLTPTLQVLLRATVAPSCPQIARYPFCQSHPGSLAWRGVRRRVWSSLTLSPSLPHPLCLALQPIPLLLSPTHFLISVMEMVVPITAMILAHHSTNSSLSSLSMESYNRSTQWAATTGAVPQASFHLHQPLLHQSDHLLLLQVCP